MTALKTTLFVLLVPVLLLAVLPAWIMATVPAPLSFGAFRWLAIPLWILGAAVMLWCAYDFTFKGRGTPAPFDPPKELVVSGPYRFVRNPMYTSGIVFLLGHVFWSPSLPLAAAPSTFLLAAHLFVTLYEEPTLRKKFGAAYEQYCRDVPRWIPRA
jgi:protein-S-isoprenylcysteine O-methyltransferase Ste14